jgi:homopolymeric O-antigen transport system ATP-binding protein
MAVMLSVDGLGKRYRLGENTAGYGRLTESLSNRLRRRRGRDVATHGEIWALRDASFEIEQGEVVGLIGRNGAGKSTLLKLLARVTRPTVGRAEIRGRVGSLLEVGTGFHQELTGRENVYLSGAILGMRRTEIQRKFDEIVAFAGIESFIDTPVKRYSSGMGVRLGFAVAAFLEPEVLLVDEVLAVGDLEFRRKCLGRISEVSQEDGRTIVFVSHDLNAILSTCSRAIFVEEGRILMDGPATDVVSRYESHQSALARSDGEFVRTDAAPQFPVPLLTHASIISNGETRGHVVHGSSFVLRLKTNAESQVPRFGIDVRLLDARRRPVSYISSIEMQDIYFDAGDVIDLQIPYLPLASGLYLVELLAHITGRAFDFWSEEIAFDVVHFDPFQTGSTFTATPERGSVVPQHEWSVATNVGSPVRHAGA